MCITKAIYKSFRELEEFKREVFRVKFYFLVKE